MTDVPTTSRWIATHASARQAARAFLGVTLRRPAIWVFFAVVEVMFAIVIALSFDEHYGVATRVVWGAVYALVPMLGIAGISLGTAHLLNVRRFRLRLREGVALEACIGERSVFLRGPWSEITLSFDGIASMRTNRGWVFLQQVGVPFVSVWPAELFAPADLTRLARSIDTPEP